MLTYSHCQDNITHVMFSLLLEPPKHRSALLLGRIAPLCAFRRALPARRLAALGARAGPSTDCQGTGLRGKQAAAVARLPTGTWLGVQSGTPQVLMGVDTPPGTKARDSLTVYAIDEEGNAHNAIARVPHGLWERLADPTSFNVRRDEAAGGAEIAGGGDRLFVAGIGDSLEVFEYRVGDDAREPPRSPVSPAGMPRQGVHQVFASREGSLWIGQHDPAAEVFRLPRVRGVIGRLVPDRNAHAPGERPHPRCVSGQGPLRASRFAGAGPGGGGAAGRIGRPTDGPRRTAWIPSPPPVSSD